MGSLTATRQNMTMGVQKGIKENQKARGVSGFLATLMTMK